MPRHKAAPIVLQRSPSPTAARAEALLLAGIRARRLRSCVDSLAQAVERLELEEQERTAALLWTISDSCAALLRELGQ